MNSDPNTYWSSRGRHPNPICIGAPYSEIKTTKRSDGDAKISPVQVICYINRKIESAQGNPLSDLRLQTREVQSQPNWLPAIMRPGNSENTSKQRHRLFLLPAWPSLNMCHLFGILRLVSARQLLKEQ
jgi:hypothetical protein